MGGGGSTYDYGFRIYNPSLGRFLSVDPLFLSYPWYTPYQFAGNKPIWAIDLDGLEEKIVTGFRRFWKREAVISFGIQGGLELGVAEIGASAADLDLYKVEWTLYEGEEEWQKESYTVLDKRVVHQSAEIGGAGTNIEYSTNTEIVEGEFTRNLGTTFKGGDMWALNGTDQGKQIVEGGGTKLGLALFGKIEYGVTTGYVWGDWGAEDAKYVYASQNSILQGNTLADDMLAQKVRDAAKIQVQVGAYSDHENAIKRAAEFNGYVLPEGGLFKAIVDTDTPTAAKELMDKVKDDNAFIRNPDVYLDKQIHDSSKQCSEDD